MEFKELYLPLIISGIAFFSYRHPIEARGLLKILFLALVGVYVVGEAFYAGEAKQYIASIRSVPIQVHQTKDFPYSNNADSLRMFEKDRECDNDISDNERIVKDSIWANIKRTEIAASENNTSFIETCGVLAVTIVLFFSLCPVFEKVKTPSGKGQNDSSD